MKRNDMHANHIPNVIAAACVLHKYMVNTSIMLGYKISLTAITLSLPQLLLEIAPATNPNV